MKWKKGWKVILVYKTCTSLLIRLSATHGFRAHSIDYPKEEVVVRPDKAIGGPLAVFKTKYRAKRFTSNLGPTSGKLQIVRCLYLPSEETELYEYCWCRDSYLKLAVSVLPTGTALAEKVKCLA